MIYSALPVAYNQFPKRATEGVYEDIEALTTDLKSFKEDGCATASGLL